MYQHYKKSKHSYKALTLSSYRRSSRMNNYYGPSQNQSRWSTHNNGGHFNQNMPRNDEAGRGRFPEKYKKWTQNQYNCQPTPNGSNPSSQSASDPENRNPSGNRALGQPSYSQVVKDGHMARDEGLKSPDQPPNSSGSTTQDHEPSNPPPQQQPVFFSKIALGLPGFEKPMVDTLFNLTLLMKETGKKDIDWEQTLTIWNVLNNTGIFDVDKEYQPEKDADQWWPYAPAIKQAPEHQFWIINLKQLEHEKCQFFRQYDPTVLCHIFYFGFRNRPRLLAARVLKEQGWKFNLRHKIWLKNFGPPRFVTDFFEMGNYLYFDYEDKVTYLLNRFRLYYSDIENFDLSFLE